MATRIKAHEAAVNAGYANAVEALRECIDGTAHCPACCSEGCETEIDGECEHGFPSIGVALGVV